MSKLGLFLLLSSVFLVGALMATGLVWYLLVIAPLRESASLRSDVPSATASDASSEADTAVDTSLETPPEPNVLPTITESIVIPLASHTEAQQTVVRTLGVAEGDTITITRYALLCAEAKLIAELLRSIFADDTPSISEGFTLVNCL